jgi:hypothetical protein
MGVFREAAYLGALVAQVREVTVTSCGAATDERAGMHAMTKGYGAACAAP